MDEQEIQEFSLEDIIKEFSDAPAVPEEPEEQELPAEESAEEEPVQEESIPEVEEVEEEKPSMEDTQVMQLPEKEAENLIPEEVFLEDTQVIEVPEEVSMEITRVIELPQVESQEEDPTADTIRMEAVRFGKGEVNNAEPVAEEEEPAKEEAEPFSEGWEPEYEQPIAEYAPPRPILIHPRSRLRELKSKLVAGPEKAYYALLEKGLGKIQVSIFFSLILFIASAVATTMHAFNLVGDNRMKLLVFGQFLVMMIAALLGSSQLIRGVEDLFKKRFSLNTMLVLSFVLCCADGVLCLYELPRVADPRVPCCAAFALQMIMSLWNTYHKRNTKLGQLDTMRKASRLDSLCVLEDCYEGTNGLLRGEGRVEDFMDTYKKPAKLEKTISVYAIVAACCSIALGLAAGALQGLKGGLLQGVSAGVQTAAVTTLAAVPASLFVALSRPMAILERRLHRLGGVLCGWQGVEGLSKKAVFPLDHEDLCPVGTVKLNGVKFYGDRESDEIIAYCAALCNADGGALAAVFNHLLESRNGIAYEVADFRDYGNGGIGGEVNAEPVLVGTLPFLRSMGVEVADSLKVKHAVGISVDGELCGLFAIAYEKVRSIHAGIATLTGYRKLQTVLTSNDFMITDEFIKNQFGVNTKRILFPTWEDRAALRAKKLEEDAPAMAMSTNGTLASFAYCVTGAKALKSAAKLGTIVHMIGGILGMAMMLTLAVLGALHLLTPANMFLYELVWLVPGLLITEWTRSI